MGRYVFELIRQLQSHDDLEWVMLGDDIMQPMTIPEGARAIADVFEFRGDRFHFWEQLGVPLRTYRHDVDVLHCTESTLPLWQPKPTVVTVHDTLMWEELPPGVTAELYFNRVMPAALTKCAGLITISESSKNDILGKWPWLESKLTVIPHGIGNEYFNDEHSRLPSTLQSQVGDNPYVVYLGGTLERKRFAWALNVFARCRIGGLKLIACGFGEQGRCDARNNLPYELVNEVIFAEFLSDEDLISVYKNAKAVLYPTLYEGFGFPAIEGQAAGVPVLFSALGSLVELRGPLAVVLPPFDLDSWVGALNSIISEGVNSDQVKEAKAWAAEFRWAVSAEKHLDVYRKAVSSGRQ